MSKPTKFAVTTEIAPGRISDIICTGFEGGMVSQWCRVMKTDKPKGEIVASCGDEVSWWDYPVQGGALICRLDDGDTEDTDKKYTALVLDAESIQRGLSLMAEKWPRHWSSFMDENEDAITGDVFLQCCLLGDIVYG